jgi:prepilin-type N-terminal cleavage/methylation domain-containing protein/prepilin-type processing-associated H-X9-DG protein
MNRQKGFTLVELLVVISIIALLMGVLLPALSRAREQGKRAVCLHNLSQLMVAWSMYADDNSEKPPWSDVYYSWVSDPAPPGYGPCWVEPDHAWPHGPMSSTTQTTPLPYPNPKKADWEHCISEGSLWKYVKEYKIYACPVGDKGEMITYSIVDSMNGCRTCAAFYGNVGAETIRLRNQIRNTAMRIVFLDEGKLTPGSWVLKPQNEAWFDPPPVRHGEGVSVAFADTHTEYRKWVDKRTAKTTWTNGGGGSGGGNGIPQLCNADLKWMHKSVWGKIYFKQGGTCPPE